MIFEKWTFFQKLITFAGMSKTSSDELIIIVDHEQLRLHSEKKSLNITKMPPVHDWKTFGMVKKLS